MKKLRLLRLRIRMFIYNLFHKENRRRIDFIYEEDE